MILRPFSVSFFHAYVISDVFVLRKKAATSTGNVAGNMPTTAHEAVLIWLLALYSCTVLIHFRSEAIQQIRFLTKCGSLSCPLLQPKA